MTKESFDSIMKLFKQTFLWRRYKAQNIVVAILFWIATAPFLIDAVALLIVYKVLSFVFRLIKSPADALSDLLKFDGKEVKHATQAVIFFVGYPIVFLLNVCICFLMPVFYILYFLINCLLWLVSIGDIQFNVYVNNKVERDMDENKNYDFSTGAVAVFGALGAIMVVSMIVCLIVMACSRSAAMNAYYSNYYSSYYSSYYNNSYYAARGAYYSSYTCLNIMPWFLLIFTLIPTFLFKVIGGRSQVVTKQPRRDEQPEEEVEEELEQPEEEPVEEEVAPVKEERPAAKPAPKPVEKKSEPKTISRNAVHENFDNDNFDF